MSEQKTGPEVVEQSHDASLPNTEPVVLRSAITGIVAAVLAILYFSGIISDADKRAIEEQVNIIIPALVLLIPVIAGIVSRAAAFSPRSAARIAVLNAKQPAGTPPTILSPP